MIFKNSEELIFANPYFQRPKRSVLPYKDTILLEINQF